MHNLQKRSTNVINDLKRRKPDTSNNVKKVIVIGAVASGIACACRLRRISETVNIILLEKTSSFSYGVCGMPMYISGVIPEEKLSVAKKNIIIDGMNIDMRLGQEVMKINREKKTVTVKNLNDQKIYDETYEKLVIATGSEFVKKDIVKGCKYVYNLKTVKDMKNVKKRVEKSKCVLVDSFSFVGLEIAESLIKKGLKVYMVDKYDQFLNSSYDKDIVKPLQEKFAEKGAEILFNNGIVKLEYFEKKDKVVVNLKDSKVIEVDMVLLGGGLRPNSKIAKECGLELVKGLETIKVDERLRTSDKDIYATGDVTEMKSITIDQKGIWFPLANVATRQSRICANSIFNVNNVNFRGTVATGCTKFFDLTVGNIGFSEKKLIKDNVKYEKCITIVTANAPYMMKDVYPETYYNAYKLLFDENGLILGCQVSGKDDMLLYTSLTAISCYIQGKMTVFQLAEIEIGYSPHYGKPRHPLNEIGLISSRILNQTGYLISSENAIKNKYRLIDVRDTPQFNKTQSFNFKNSENIPFHLIRKMIKEGKFPDKEEKIATICNIGKKAYFIATMFQNLGYKNVFAIAGGVFYYHRHGKND